MKRYLIFSSVVFSLFALNACASKPHYKQAQPGAGLKQDFLTTGRELSKGAVDLYQPGADFSPTAQFPGSGRGTSVSPVSGNSNIVVNDPSVTIYSLDTMNVSEPQPAPLPPFQPPVSISGSYPSPFDKNGNFTK